VSRVIFTLCSLKAVLSPFWHQIVKVFQIIRLLHFMYIIPFIIWYIYTSVLNTVLFMLQFLRGFEKVDIISIEMNFWQCQYMYIYWIYIYVMQYKIYARHWNWAAVMNTWQVWIRCIKWWKISINWNTLNILCQKGKVQL
jgi:hypothetical protein